MEEENRQYRFEEALRSFLSSRKKVMIVVIVMVVLIIVGVLHAFVTRPGVVRREEVTEVDPASGVVLGDGGQEAEADVDGVLYLGFADISTVKFSENERNFFKLAVKKYAEKNEIELFRVSMLKDSGDFDTDYNHRTFTIVLNRDQETLETELLMSRMGGFTDLEVIFRKDKKEVFRY